MKWGEDAPAAPLFRGLLFGLMIEAALLLALSTIALVFWALAAR